jgi:poly(A) polymerase
MMSLLETPPFELALAALLHRLEPAVVEGIGKRWKLSNAEIDQTTWLVARQRALLEADRLTAAQLKRTLAHPYRDALLALTHAWLLATGRELHPVLFAEEYLRRTPPEQLDPPPVVTGRELIQLGLAPGPRFKELLEQVRDAQLNGEVSTTAAALAYIQRLQGHPSTGTP